MPYAESIVKFADSTRIPILGKEVARFDTEIGQMGLPAAIQLELSRRKVEIVTNPNTDKSLEKIASGPFL